MLFRMPHIKKKILFLQRQNNGPVAQLDRAPDYGSGGCGFESRRVHIPFFMKSLLSILFSFIAIVILTSTTCKRPVEYPPEPTISFKSFTVKDTIDALDNQIKKGTLAFTFIDGDGDIGLKPEDTVPPYDSTYYYNLFLQGYYYQNGAIVADSPAVPLYYRIPYIEPQGQNKVLKGTIKVDIIYNLPVPHDSIFYKFYIVDRKLHHSNTAQTPVIVFSE